MGNTLSTPVSGTNKSTSIKHIYILLLLGLAYVPITASPVELDGVALRMASPPSSGIPLSKPNPAGQICQGSAAQQTQAQNTGLSSSTGRGPLQKRVQNIPPTTYDQGAIGNGHQRLCVQMMGSRFVGLNSHGQTDPKPIVTLRDAMKSWTRRDAAPPSALRGLLQDASFRAIWTQLVRESTKHDITVSAAAELAAITPGGPNALVQYSNNKLGSTLMQPVCGCL
jgi:hypothetical protein